MDYLNQSYHFLNVFTINGRFAKRYIIKAVIVAKWNLLLLSTVPQHDIMIS